LGRQKLGLDLVSDAERKYILPFGCGKKIAISIKKLGGRCPATDCAGGRTAKLLVGMGLIQKKTPIQ